MNEEQVSAAIDEMERALQVEDPGLVRRVHALRRADVVNCVTVFALLAVGTVLLTVGLATVAWLPWSIGLIALVVAVAIDAHHQRALRLPRQGDPRHFR
jgi:fatty acid desaturase